jgi:hypothetical protein
MVLIQNNYHVGSCPLDAHNWGQRSENDFRSPFFFFFLKKETQRHFLFHLFEI